MLLKPVDLGHPRPKQIDLHITSITIVAPREATIVLGTSLDSCHGGIAIASPWNATIALHGAQGLLLHGGFLTAEITITDKDF